MPLEIRKVAQLFDARLVDIWVRREVVEERSRAALGRADDHEGWLAWQAGGPLLALCDGHAVVARCGLTSACARTHSRTHAARTQTRVALRDRVVELRSTWYLRGGSTGERECRGA
eukprot:6510891-Prymnesium_polylepis.1